MSSWLGLPGAMAPGLPEHFHFMDLACRASSEELPQFAAVRAAFGVDEETFKADAEDVLAKVIAEGQVSTAKSGSLMAFHGDFMAKSMTEEEASTLMVILEAYLEHIRHPDNARGESCPGSLLPRFFGAYIYSKEWSLSGLLDKRMCFIVTANVFAGVPKDIMSSMERFDLKGSADDRAQRKPGGEYMCFDLLRRDQKFTVVHAAEGEALLAQLERDTAFLLSQHMPRGPLGLIDYDQLPENYRGAPGLMDYSLLVGVAPRGAPGGCVRMDVREQRLVLEVDRENEEREEEEWRTQAADRTVLVGIIDILQFWTPKKRLARRFKKFMHMERDDDNEYNGKMLDTVRPEHYRPRFLAFMREAFSECSWAESIPRLYGCKGEGLVQRLVGQLPEPQRRRLSSLKDPWSKADGDETALPTEALLFF